MINGTSRQLFGEESDCRKGSSISKAEPSVSRSGRRLKGKISNSNTDT